MQAARDVLSAIPYSENSVYYHSDASLMPVNRKAWASWNLLGSRREGEGTIMAVDRKAWTSWNPWSSWWKREGTLMPVNMKAYA